ncbi:MAG: prolyl oligopeptidase family serine peptidase [candidate division WOR-3 bacterium]
MNPPKPKKIPYIRKKFNDITIDYYHWMRDRNDPDLLEYIRAENEYINKISEKFKDLEKELYNEFLNRIEEEKISYPYKYGDFYYFYKVEKDRPYKTYYRTNGIKEEVILNVNEIAKNYSYFAIGDLKIERYGNFLAFNYDIEGSENYKLFLKNLKTDELKFITDRTFYSIEWFKNYLFFTLTTEDTLRPYKVMKLNISNFEMEEVFREDNESYEVSLYKSKDEKFLFIVVHSLDTTEIWFLDENFNLKLFKERKKNIRYFLEHNGGYFYILTNEFDENFGIYKCNTKNFEEIEEIIKPRRNIKINNFEMFEKFMAIHQTDIENAIDKISIFDFEKNECYDIEFPDEVYVVNFIDNYEFDSEFVRLEYESLIQPRTIYDYDVKSKSLILRKQEKVNNFNKEFYKMERLFVDGIPITLAYKKELFKKDGSNVLWAYGYGAYGVSIKPYFSIEKLSILDRGIVYAIIHVRGGGEKGERWHKEGKLLNKKNTIFDFIKACEFLIKNKYTSEGKIIVEGASAGGILVGGVINQRPELFKLAIAEVPFVDVLNTMLDPNLPLTILEYDEWGNPEIEEFYYYIKSYSPYDNIKEQNYPHILAISGFNDQRVRYWEPLKWIAKLRELNKSDSIICIKIHLDAGHYVGENKHRILREKAFIIAFALHLI